MKRPMFLILLVLFLGSCTGTCPADKTSKDNIALVEQYIDAVEAGDYAAIESMLADDYRGIGPSYNDSINKADGLESWKYNLENLYEKVEYVRSRNIAVTLTDGEYPGDWVSNWGELSITYQDGSGPVHVFANTLYKIEDGKISNSFTIYNEYDVLYQLGMLP